MGGWHLKNPNAVCEFAVDVWSDDSCAYLRVDQFEQFDPAVAAFEKLTSGPYAGLRVTMRHKAHVFREYVPARLRR